MQILPHGRHARSRRRVMFSILVTMVSCLVMFFISVIPAKAQSLLSFNQLVAETAKQYIGAPYVYAGTGPGFDCSGLAMTVYGRFGKELEHTAEWDYQNGKIIPQSEAWGGDLVVFLSGGYAYHVGIYEGGDSMVSALDYQYGVRWTPLSWGGPDYAFVTFSH
jgi:peptidoglycan DL-endopeptidase CwlO